jgi:hypothetical protein
MSVLYASNVNSTNGVKASGVPRALFLGPASSANNATITANANANFYIPASSWTSQSALTTNITLRAADSGVSIVNNGIYTLSFGYYANTVTTAYWYSVALQRNIGYMDYNFTTAAGHRPCTYTGPLIAGDVMVPIVVNRDGSNTQNIIIEASCILTVVTHQLI